MEEYGDEPCKQEADTSEAPEPEHVEQFEAKFAAMICEEEAN